MRIVIDLQACQSSGSRNRGIGRYSMALARAMARQAAGHEVWLALNRQFPDTIPTIRKAFSDILPAERIFIFDVPASLAEVHPANAWRTRSAERIRQHAIAQLQPDIAHVTSLFEGCGDDVVASVDADLFSRPTVVTLYDLIPLLHSETYLANSQVYQWYHRKLQSLQNTDLLLAISESTRQDAIRVLNLPEENVINISSAIDDQFQQLTLSPDRIQTLRAKYGLQRSIVMYTGGIDRRKNIEGLIEAYSNLPEEVRCNHQLAIVCAVRPLEREHFITLSRKNGLNQDELVLTGYVPDEDLVALYNLCDLFIFPSLYEGFGLPVLEAMACGAPVIGSDLSSIPEIIGRQDALFDPTQVEAITRSMYHALSDDGFRQSLRDYAPQQAAKFSWQESARRALEGFEALYERETQSRRSQISVPAQRLHLAFVSPLPPERSGIADYSLDLLRELSKFYRITLIVDQEKVENSWLIDNFEIREVTWFEKNAEIFDRILYQFGNSSFHKHMFRLLEQYPGVVVLHDFFLSNLIEWMDKTNLSPSIFSHSLYDSHGYPALLKTIEDRGRELAIWAYPCNRKVLSQAVGVIAHSHYAVDLARRWYSDQTAQNLSMVPLLKALPSHVNRQQARSFWGLRDEDFLVCSFGLVGPTKLSDRLLKAWLTSSLAHNQHCHLVFVGQVSAADYEQELINIIRKAGLQNRVCVTGFVSTENFNHYLAAADAAVQLRTFSRGETSAAVLDVMAYGLPLVVNAHGTMAEYPEETLIKLSDNFSNDELTKALEELHQKPVLRSQLGKAAKDYIAQNHSPEQVGKQYYAAIEDFSLKGQRVSYHSLLSTISDNCDDVQVNIKPNEADLVTVAKTITANLPRFDKKQILIDISILSQNDEKPGVQSDARNLLSQVLHHPPAGYRVEPVYWNGAAYLYARSFVHKFLELSEIPCQDSVIDIRQGDIFLGLDFTLELALSSERLQMIEELSRTKLKVFFVVYDILPAKRPDWWEENLGQSFIHWLEVVTRISTGLICISQTVTKDVKHWISEHPVDRVEDLRIESFHLGADIKSNFPSRRLPDGAEQVLDTLRTAPSFLMVGTVESHRGHTQVLSALEQLWSKGVEANLAIVGDRDWRKMEEFENHLNHHPQLGQRLFWLQGISDEYLDKVYAVSTALIAASEAEGFGLPLIEAAQHSLPIIARDISVFREVAGDHAFYFSGDSPDQLANAIEQWLDLYAQGKAPISASMPWLTWEESAQQLMDIITTE